MALGRGLEIVLRHGANGAKRVRQIADAWAVSPISLGMHPDIRRYHALLRQSDHVRSADDWMPCAPAQSCACGCHSCADARRSVRPCGISRRCERVSNSTFRDMRSALMGRDLFIWTTSPAAAQPSVFSAAALGHDDHHRRSGRGCHGARLVWSFGGM